MIPTLIIAFVFEVPVSFSVPPALYIYIYLLPILVQVGLDKLYELYKPPREVRQDKAMRLGRKPSPE